MRQLRLLGLAIPLLILTACAARPPASTELDIACNNARSKLQTVSKTSLKQSEEKFDYQGKSFQGCSLSVIGDRIDITPSQYPEALFYPAENSEQQRAGWRADNEADGPDGTAFRIIRSNVFCAVRGQWDGGDDSNPSYIPSTRVEFTVQCSRIKQ